MDWEKLAREAQQVEEQREQEKQAAASVVQPRSGDTILHNVLGRCVFAGYRGVDKIYVRQPNGRVVILSLDHVELKASATPRTFIATVKKKS